MKILHTSDLHLYGKSYRKLVAFNEDFDLWLDTGDHFPNVGRTHKTNMTIDKVMETQFQTRWVDYKQWGTKLANWLDGRPVVFVSGNHDFISLGTVLKRAGYKEVYEVTPEGVEVAGHKFAGFREIPYMEGEWMGETIDFNDLVEGTMASGADLLVTHGPAAGILDEAGYGISKLMSHLTHAPHGFTHHFFGHCHAQGGQVVDEMGIQFINGAGHKIVHTV